MAVFTRQISDAHAVDAKSSVKTRATPAKEASRAFRGRPIERTRRYIVCYDTPDDGRRREFSRLLSSWGVRVQWSVFECLLNGQELVRLSRALDRVVNANADDVRIFQCGVTGQPTHGRLAQYADQPSDYWVS